MPRILNSDSEAFRPVQPEHRPFVDDARERQLHRYSTGLHIAGQTANLLGKAADVGAAGYGGFQDWAAKRNAESAAKDYATGGGGQASPEAWDRPVESAPMDRGERRSHEPDWSQQPEVSRIGENIHGRARYAAGTEGMNGFADSSGRQMSPALQNSVAGAFGHPTTDVRAATPDEAAAFRAKAEGIDRAKEAMRGQSMQQIAAQRLAAARGEAEPSPPPAPSQPSPPQPSASTQPHGAVVTPTGVGLRTMDTTSDLAQNYGSPAYNLEASRQIGAPRQPVAAGGPAPETLGGKVPLWHPVPDGQRPATPSATAPPPAAIRAAMQTPPPAAPAQPEPSRKLADMTDAEVQHIHDRVAGMAQTQGGEWANHLKEVDAELEHRKSNATRDYTFDELAAEARMAHTPDQQAAVLAKGARVRMPVRSLEDLFANHGDKVASALQSHFPAVPKRTAAQDLEDEAQALEHKARAKALEAKTPAEIERLLGLGARGQAQAREADARAEERRGMLPYKKDESAERTQKIHREEEKLIAETKTIDALRIPKVDEINANTKQLQALAAKAARAHKNGGGLSAADLKIAKEFGDRGHERVMEAENVAKQAEAAAERAVNAVDRAQMHAELLAREVGDEQQIVPGVDFGDALAAKHKHNDAVGRARAEADAAKKQAERLAAVRDSLEIKAQEARAVSVAALRAGDADRAAQDAIYNKRLPKAKAAPKAAKPAPIAAPVPKAGPPTPDVG